MSKHLVEERIAQLLQHHSELISQNASKEELAKNMKLIEYYKHLKNKNLPHSNYDHGVDVMEAAKNCVIDTDELERSQQQSKQLHNNPIYVPTPFKKAAQESIVNYPTLENSHHQIPVQQQQTFITPKPPVYNNANNHPTSLNTSWKLQDSKLALPKDDDTVSIASSSVNDEPDMMDIDMLQANVENDSQYDVVDDDEDSDYVDEQGFAHVPEAPISKKLHALEAEAANEGYVKEELDVLQKQINHENGADKFVVPQNFLLDTRFKNEVQMVC